MNTLADILINRRVKRKSRIITSFAFCFLFIFFGNDKQVLVADGFSLEVKEFKVEKIYPKENAEDFELLIRADFAVDITVSDLLNEKIEANLEDFYSNSQCEIILPIKTTLNKLTLFEKNYLGVAFSVVDSPSLPNYDHNLCQRVGYADIKDEALILKFNGAELKKYVVDTKIKNVSAVIKIEGNMWDHILPGLGSKSPILNIRHNSQTCAPWARLEEFDYNTWLLWGGGFQAFSRLNVDFENITTGEIFYLHDQLVVEDNGLYSVEFNPRNDLDELRFEYFDGSGPRRFTNYIALGNYNVIISSPNGDCEERLDNLFVRGKLVSSPQLGITPNPGPRPNPWADSPVSFRIQGNGFPPNTTVSLSMRDGEQSGQFLGPNTDVITDESGAFEIDLVDTEFCCFGSVPGYSLNPVSNLRINASERISGAFASSLYEIVDPKVRVDVDDIHTQRPDGGFHVVENAGRVKVQGVGFLPNTTLSCTIRGSDGPIIIRDDATGQIEFSIEAPFSINTDNEGRFSYYVTEDYWPQEYRRESQYLAVFRWENDSFGFQKALPFILNEASLEGSGWPDIDVVGYEYSQVVSKGPHATDIPIVSGKETLLRIYYTCDNSITNTVRADLEITKPGGEILQLERRDLPLQSGTTSISDVDRTDINSTINFLLPANLVPHTEFNQTSFLDFSVSVWAHRALDTDMSNNIFTARIPYENPREFHTVFRVLHTHTPRQINRRNSYDTELWRYAKDIIRVLPLNRISYHYWESNDNVTPTFHLSHWGDEWDNELADDSILTSAITSAGLSEYFDSDPPHDSNDILKWYTFVPLVSGYNGPFGKGYNWVGGGESAVGFWVEGENTSLHSSNFQPFYNKGTQTFVHETGHNLGRDHVNQEGAEPDDSDPDFPYSGADATGLGDGTWNGGLGYYWDYSDYLGRRNDDGSRKKDNEIIKILSNDTYTDLMSYGDYRWISDWQYLKIRDEIQSQRQTSINLNAEHSNLNNDSGNPFQVRQNNEINEQASKINFLTLIQDDSKKIIYERLISVDSADYHKRLSNYGEKDLANSVDQVTVTLTLQNSSEKQIKLPGKHLSKESDGRILYNYVFQSSLPVVSIKVFGKDMGDPLLEKDISTKLDVTVIDSTYSPSNNDADKNYLRFNFQSQKNSLSKFIVAAQYKTPQNKWRSAPFEFELNQNSGNISIPLENIDGNSKTKIRFIFNEGLNSQTVELDGFYSLEPVEPTLIVHEPIMHMKDGLESKIFNGKKGIPFSARITNLRDGPNTSYVWLSDIVGQFAEGKNVIKNLPAGMHNITCLAIANNGLKVSESFAIEVFCEKHDMGHATQVHNARYLDKDSDFIDDNWELSITTDLASINQHSDYNKNNLPDFVEYKLASGSIGLNDILESPSIDVADLVDGWNLYSGEYVQNILDTVENATNIVTILEFNPNSQNWSVVFDSGKFINETQMLNANKGYWFLYDKR
ncbi:hypothetical protein OAH76_04165 [Verrucomicrobia bacterium]|nr:hypothetical protein [bacterium]MDB4804039.1 hypothetical protein [Verrucomicrobiota bacterium]